MVLFKKTAPLGVINSKSPTYTRFALCANYLRNQLEFPGGRKYYDASIFQPTFNTFLASPGLG